MQIGGAGWRIEAGHLRAALQKSPSLTRLLLRYVQAHTVQVSETAMANGLLSMEQRLARWLLMCRLRTGVDDLPLTHEFLSIMLGVQRTGVTIALQSLERGAMIVTRRGHVSVRDHLKLEAVAGDAYGVPEAEYRRLCGAF
jgi:CRP-like cAMP-binding protein